MADGTCKPISQVVVGDLLPDDNRVSATLQVLAKGLRMFDLHGVLVSESHVVYHSQLKQWIYVRDHSDAIEITDSYTKPVLHCLNTTAKTFWVHDLLCTDWDEMIDSSGSPIRTTHGGQPIHEFCATLQPPVQMSDISLSSVTDLGGIVYGKVQYWTGPDSVGHHVLTSNHLYRSDTGIMLDYNAFL